MFEPGLLLFAVEFSASQTLCCLFVNNHLLEDGCASVQRSSARGHKLNLEVQNELRNFKVLNSEKELNKDSF